MARKRKRARAAPASRPAQASPTRQAATPAGRPLPPWRWRTFPVFFAFVTGIVVAFLVNPPATVGDNLASIVQLIALAGFGYGLAHLFVRNVIVVGRLRRQRQAAERGEEPPEAFEEELVYPDEDTNDKE